jgi:hypothetical protein
MMRARRRLGLLLLLLLGAAAADARGVTLYVERIVVADRGPVRLGDLVRASGDVPLQAGEALATSIAALSDRLLYIPSRSYSDTLEGGFGTDSIIVGSRSLVVPRGTVPDNELPIMDRLVDFLANQGVLGDERADLDVRLNDIHGALPPDPNPAFQLVRSAKGSVEVSFTAGSSGGAAGGRIVLAVTGGGSGAVEVRARDPVRVVFHRGPITIEMQGKALSAAALGDSVKVQVSDSQKSFTGRVAAGKAVDVDLP